ncbi:MAG: S24/S26 family peptidase [Terriglobales bacterium]
MAVDALRRSGRLRLQVHGESMLPALWPGDVVEIASCSPEDVQPGEMVLALREDRFFLHRFVSPCKPSGFLLCGDSMPGSDPPFPLEALLGRMVRNGNAGDVFSATWFGAKCSRALGLLLCHCGLARRLALKLHHHWKASADKFRNRERAADIRSAEPEAL